MRVVAPMMGAALAFAGVAISAVGDAQAGQLQERQFGTDSTSGFTFGFPFPTSSTVSLKTPLATSTLRGPTVKSQSLTGEQNSSTSQTSTSSRSTSTASSTTTSSSSTSSTSSSSTTTSTSSTPTSVSSTPLVTTGVQRTTIVTTLVTNGASITSSVTSDAPVTSTTGFTTSTPTLYSSGSDSSQGNGLSDTNKKVIGGVVGGVGGAIVLGAIAFAVLRVRRKNAAPTYDDYSNNQHDKPALLTAQNAGGQGVQHPSNITATTNF